MQKVFISLIPIVLVAVVAASLLSSSITTPTMTNPTFANLLAYHSLVTITYTPFGGTPRIISSHHNFFSTAGQESIFNLLGASGNNSARTTNFTVIALCNDTGATGCLQAYIDSGLTNVTGTVVRIGAGNWSVANTFTSTVNNKDINATGLFNGTTAGSTYFAGNNFTKVTLQNLDQITVTWNLSVS